MQNPIVCMISCLHPLLDDRIYWKESLSLKKAGYSVIHLGVSREDTDYITPEGIRIISIKRKRYFANPFIDKIYRILSRKPNLYKNLLSKAADLQANIYHFHDYQLNRIGPKLKKLAHNPKVIYDVHEPYPEIQRYLSGKIKLFSLAFSWYIYKLQKQSAKYYDYIITTESNVLNHFKKFYPSNRIFVVPNYSNICRGDSKNNNKEFDVVYLGGISKWRGIFELLQIAKLSKEKGTYIKILCLGMVKERGLENKIQSIINKHQLTDIFYLKQYIPHSEVSQSLLKSKIGFCVFKDNPIYKIIMPIKIFEYMAFGLPVICNNFGHSGAIINQEGCGIAINKINAEEIYRVIIELLHNPKKYKEMSEAGEKAFEFKYRWEYAEKDLLKIYNSLQIKNF